MNQAKDTRCIVAAEDSRVVSSVRELEQEVNEAVMATLSLDNKIRGMLRELGIPYVDQTGPRDSANDAVNLRCSIQVIKATVANIERNI